MSKSKPSNDADISHGGRDVGDRGSEDWSTPAGELFVHSHIYESEDGAESEGLDEVVGKDAMRFSEALGKLRSKYAPDDLSIVPSGVDEIDHFIADQFDQLRTNSMNKHGFGADDVFVVGPKGGLTRFFGDGSEAEIIAPDDAGRSFATPAHASRAGTGQASENGLRK